MEVDVQDRAPEHKAGIAHEDGIVTRDEMMRVFEAFKTENDANLAAIARGRSDPLTEQKVDRINAELSRRIDDLTLKNARPALGRDSAALSHDAREHKAAFHAYVRSGEAGNLRQLEAKALSVGSNPDGGYTVPVEIEKEIGRRLTAISPIRGIAGQREISGNVYKKPFMIAGPSVGWVGETAARPQTDSPTLDALSFPAMELYAMPAATSTLLEDSAVNIDEWLAAEIASDDLLQKWWRPIYALELSLLECPGFALTLLHALWFGHEAGINGFGTLSHLLIAYFGARFGVLGVYITGRSREKQACSTGQLAPSVVGEVVKALVKKK